MDFLFFHHISQNSRFARLVLLDEYFIGADVVICPYESFR